MHPTFALAHKEVLAPAPSISFAVRHSREIPTYYELSLEDSQGSRAHWVVPLPLKQLNKRPVLLWLLSASPMLNSLARLESGAVQLASEHVGISGNLRTELAQGLLRLNFSGRLLRGYYRLQCLPTGCGQLWQLTPIGQI
ncbi:hypothetical protein [Hymenobacter sp. BT190]|uniref:hypothetical protein n=1 Tax=Hymenobacter sp. BT190 TaxID=2763505 RepID=UPI001651122B|nr:hypothetical protein [Hymenobacter sp. BT190]MBC6699542.1 hypothetical protein [Hymenobacter sp. BT190]